MKIRLITCLQIIVVSFLFFGDLKSLEASSYKDEVKLLLDDFLNCRMTEYRSDQYSCFNPRSACNIAVANALHKIFNNSELKRKGGEAYTANEIYDYLMNSADWEEIGNATDQYALEEAQRYANKRYQVIAVMKEEPHGHVAFVLPGVLRKQSGKLRKCHPGMFSFFMDDPNKSTIGIGMNWVFPECKMNEVKLYRRKDALWNLFDNNIDWLTNESRECKESERPPKIVIKNMSSRFGESFSGYVSHHRDDTVTSITVFNRTENSTTIYSKNVKFTHKGPNTVCWEMNDLKYFQGNNHIVFEAKGGGPKGSWSSRDKKVIIYPYDNISGGLIAAAYEEQADRSLAGSPVYKNGREIKIQKIELLPSNLVNLNGYVASPDSILECRWTINRYESSGSIDYDKRNGTWSLNSLNLSDVTNTIRVVALYSDNILVYDSIVIPVAASGGPPTKFRAPVNTPIR